MKPSCYISWDDGKGSILGSHPKRILSSVVILKRFEQNWFLHPIGFVCIIVLILTTSLINWIPFGFCNECGEFGIGGTSSRDA